MESQTPASEVKEQFTLAETLVGVAAIVTFLAGIPFVATWTYGGFIRAYIETAANAGVSMEVAPLIAIVFGVIFSCSAMVIWFLMLGCVLAALNARLDKRKEARAND